LRSRSGALRCTDAALGSKQQLDAPEQAAQRCHDANRSDALRHRADSRYRQRGVERLDRVRSARTQQVNSIEAKNSSTHAAYPAVASV